MGPTLEPRLQRKTCNSKDDPRARLSPSRRQRARRRPSACSPPSHPRSAELCLTSGRRVGAWVCTYTCVPV